VAGIEQLQIGAPEVLSISLHFSVATLPEQVILKPQHNRIGMMSAMRENPRFHLS
jgi:hypothetical protein